MPRGQTRKTDPQEWSVREFVYYFLDVHRLVDDQNFCWILGAGASVTSKVPSGAELVEIWLREFHERFILEPDFDEWIASDDIQTLIPNFDIGDPGASYPRVFQLRYGQVPLAGYQFLERAIDRAVPSFGYSALASIVARTRHRVVITTNFDNLVADALAMHQEATPLVCGHESLAGFVRARPSRPLVAKIHRDLLLNPINDEEGTSCLLDPWGQALRGVIAESTPIVVGYGGNDGSLMGFLETLHHNDVQGRPVWCYLKGFPPNARIRRLVRELEGVLVPIQGFDELMLQVFDILGFSPQDEEMVKNAQSAALRYRQQFEALSRRLSQARQIAIATGASTIAENSSETAHAVARFADQTPGWWGYELRAQAALSVDDKRAIYEEGVREVPDSAPLHCRYARFLAEQCGEPKAAEKVFERAIALDPPQVAIITSYANFLTRQRRHKRAQALYERAVREGPDDPRALRSYALFLAEARDDHDRAEELFDRAIHADPLDVDTLMAFASYQHDHRGNPERANRVFQQALNKDPHNANLLVAFSRWLVEQNRHEQAEVHLRTARAGVRNKDNASVGTFVAFLTYLIKPVDDQLGALKALLLAGSRSPDWRAHRVVKAVAPSHPNPELLSPLADVVCGRSPIDTLDGVSVWDDAKPALPQWYESPGASTAVE